PVVGGHCACSVPLGAALPPPIKSTVPFTPVRVGKAAYRPASTASTSACDSPLSMTSVVSGAGALNVEIVSPLRLRRVRVVNPGGMGLLASTAHVSPLRF